MNLIIKTMGVVLLLASWGCSDWTETDTLKRKEPTINADQSQSYAAYLANLRQYRASDHKILIAGFDNSVKTAISYGHHLTSLPDSIDIVMLSQPLSPNEREMAEMKQMRTERGTRFIYAISYLQLEQDYEVYKKQWKTAHPMTSEPSETPEVMQTFLEYVTAQMTEQLSWNDRFGYDGISVRYDGKSLLFMPEAEKKSHLALQHAFMDAVATWREQHQTQLLMFEGNPQNLEDRTVLMKCNYLVLRSEQMTSSRELIFAITMMMQRGIPTDRFIVCAKTRSLDPADLETGVFYDEEGRESVATVELAYWTALESKDFKRCGIMVFNAQNDYYNTALTYGSLRKAISIMNPSPKMN